MKLHSKLIVPLIALVAAGVMATAAVAAAPSNTSPPTVTGTLKKGMTLTAHNGTWTGSPTTFTYRWQRCAADGTGCTGSVPAARRTRWLPRTSTTRCVSA